MISKGETPLTNAETQIADRTAKIIQDNSSRTVENLSPTEIACRELQCAYDYFNKTLFQDELPECMLTMDQSGKKVLGYYKPESFVSNDGKVIDQISLNPAFLHINDLYFVLSTLGHEACHLWVHHFTGRKTKNGYHCKKWGAKMESIGLIPSKTGKPGGKKTGYQMMDYLEPGGLFQQACDVLIENGFSLTWALRLQGTVSDDQENPKNTKDRTKGKVKFLCPICNKPCWAAPSRNLICGDDKTALVKDSQ